MSELNQDDHLSRLLPENLEPPWFVGIWNNLKEMIHPEKLPPLEITSKPIPVKDIWGLYPTDGKSIAYSVGWIQAPDVLSNRWKVDRLLRRTAECDRRSPVHRLAQ